MLDISLSGYDILFVLSIPLLLVIIIILLFLKIKNLNNTINFLTDSVPDIIWRLDDNYRITFVNAADKKIRGFEPNEVINKSIFEHITDNSKSIINMLKEIRLDEESRNIFAKTRTTEIELKCKNKPPVTMEIIIRYEYKNKQLKGFSGVARDITLRKLSEDELNFIANNDPLTKLSNRRYFMDIANREFDMAKRYSKPLSVLMFDIDFFKKVNDTYGHHAGDMVLKKVAEIGVKNLRNTDVFGRLGGEEFAVLATETELDGAILLAEKLRTTYEQSTVIVDNNKIKFTVSIGVTSITNTDKTFEDILKRADKLLYKAKQSGRNNVKFY